MTETPDSLYLLVTEDRQLTAALAITTQTCSEAQCLHELAPTSCIAMGRTLTAAALTGLIHRSAGISLQVVADSHIRQVFADVTPDGNLRGYVINPKIGISRPGGSRAMARRNIHSAVGCGSLSVIRLGQGRDFSQSTTPLVSGEIDLDVEHYLNSSDQVPSAMLCDVLLDESDTVRRAGGFLIQGLPGTDFDIMQPFREHLRREFATALDTLSLQPENLWKRFLPNASEARAVQPLQWRCRCSYERAAAAIVMLGPVDLAEMVDDKEDAHVHCDFCNQTYVVSAAEVEQAFLQSITARS